MKNEAQRGDVSCPRSHEAMWLRAVAWLLRLTALALVTGASESAANPAPRRPPASLPPREEEPKPQKTSCGWCGGARDAGCGEAWGLSRHLPPSVERDTSTSRAGLPGRCWSYSRFLQGSVATNDTLLDFGPWLALLRCDSAPALPSPAPRPWGSRGQHLVL